jgi:HipA-like protein
VTAPVTPEAPTGEMRVVRATRYVTAFREGGSLPGLVEADDDGLYVVKFRGAGQGPRVLVAEWIAGEIARALGLLVPELVAVDLAPGIADSEPDQEIHDLLEGSVGRNIGLDFLPGSMTFNPVVDVTPDPDWAASVVWLDGLVTNPDRSPKNPNLLVWHGRPWLIDHGAALYIHHAWRDPAGRARRPHAERLADHVLLPFASSIAAADERLASLVTGDLLEGLVAAVPADWLAPDAVIGDAIAQRRAYVAYLSRRLEAPRPFVEPADELRRAAA